jgi:hypothetical protein
MKELRVRPEIDEHDVEYRIHVDREPHDGLARAQPGP